MKVEHLQWRLYRRVAFPVILSLLILSMSYCKKEAKIGAVTEHEASTLANKNSMLVAAVGDKIVEWSSDPFINAERINAALASSSYTRVILPFRKDGWTVGKTIWMSTPNQELWIQGDPATSQPGKLIAGLQGGFKPTKSPLIRFYADGCTVNGYADGVNNNANSNAVLQMFKDQYKAPDYPYSEAGRSGIWTSGKSNLIIKGVTIKNAGGDGIYLSAGGSHIAVNHVVTDGASRDGISIIAVDGLTIENSTFKNTQGGETGGKDGPWAGMNFEPNEAINTINNVTVTNCTMSDNAGPNLQVAVGNLHQAGGISTPMNIRFYGCTITGGKQQGMKIAGLRPDGPSSGQIYFQKCNINYSPKFAIHIVNWAADRVKVSFNKGNVSHAGDINNQPPIIIEGDRNCDYVVGNVDFGNGFRVDDFNPNHTLIVAGISVNKWFKRIIGTSSLAGVAPFYLQRHYTGSYPTAVGFQAAAGYTNENVTLQATTVPWP